MKLGVISLKIRESDTRFGDRVSGVAELQRIIEQEDGLTLNEDTLFVVTLGDTASENTVEQGINQTVTESFGVIAAVANDGRYSDRSGIDAIDLMHDVRDELWTALLGWEWPDITGNNRTTSKVSYVGGAVIQVDHAWVWMEFDFAAKIWIDDDDGVPPEEADDFLSAYAQFKDRDELPLKAGTTLPLDDSDVLGETRAIRESAFSFSNLPSFVQNIRNIVPAAGIVTGDYAAGIGTARFWDSAVSSQFERFTVGINVDSKYALVVTDSAGVTVQGYIGHIVGEEQAAIRPVPGLDAGRSWETIGSGFVPANITEYAVYAI